MEIKRNNFKGILLTLLIIVLFILMLSEVTTYIVISINYSTLAASTSGAFNQGAISGLWASSMQQDLHTSLVAALNTLVRYEGTPSLRKNNFVNNTQSVLVTLMANGLIYGKKYTSYMGNATLKNYTNAIIIQAATQVIALTIKNQSLSVFQNSPFALNATLTGVAVAATGYGIFTFPISVTTSVNLNGTYDLGSLARVNPTIITAQKGFPTATLIGNVKATAGSKSPYQFIYGTVIVINPYGAGSPITCNANVPAAYLNDNSLILATMNAVNIDQNVCGMGGLITTAVNSLTPLKPYLVYTSTAFNAIQNNTQALLSGAGLGLYNITPLQNAIQNVYYYGSTYAPSYLDQALGPFTQRALNGYFSFKLLTRGTAFFNNPNTAGGSNIIIPASTGLTLTGPFSVSLWFLSTQPTTQTGTGYVGGLINTNQQGANSFDLLACGAVASPCNGLGISTDVGNGFAYLKANALYKMNITQNTWYNLVATYSTNGVKLFVNGVFVFNAFYDTSSYGIPDFADATHYVTIGGCPNVATKNCFSGKITNVQVYNTVLYPIEAATLYYSGIGASPVHYNSIVAWYPLNENTSDFASNSMNGIASNTISWPLANNYVADPIYQNTLNVFNTSGVAEGVLNCANINQCANTNLQHLFLTNLGLSQNNNVVGEAAALGFPGGAGPNGVSNGLLPNGLSFSGNAYLQTVAPLAWMDNAMPSNGFSMAIWVYPTSGNGVIISEDNLGANMRIPVLSIRSSSLYMSVGTFNVMNGQIGPTCTLMGSIPNNIWSHIAITYNGLGSGSNTLIGYINGNTVASNVVVRYSPRPGGGQNGGAILYYSLGKQDAAVGAVGGGCPNPAVTQGYFNGTMADFEIFNGVLNPAQVKQVYLNGSITQAGIMAVSANMIYPLSAPYNGLWNTTVETVAATASNYGYFPTCTNTQMQSGQCGLKYVAT